jgi:FkbM family methyltransferase
MILKLLTLLPGYFRRATERPKPLRFLMSNFLLLTGLGRFMTFRVQDFRLRFYPSSLSAVLWENPNDRHDDERIIRELLHKGDTFVDVGANIGALSITAALAVGETGRVLSIEPHPRIFKYLEGNLALNNIKNCQLINVALGDHVGTVRFSDRRFTDDQNSIGFAKNQKGGVDVPLQLLDDLTGLFPIIHVLKIDVEGYESFVLKGAKQTLAKTNTLFFESFEPTFQQNGSSCAEIFDFIETQGFTIHQQQNGTWQPIESGYVSKVVENLLAQRSPSTPSVFQV